MVSFIEELSMNAWPGLRTYIYDGWVVRFSEGVTRRANSIIPIHGSSIEIDEKINYTESLYRSNDINIAFKVTNESFPKNLDTILEKKGYNKVDETSVQVVCLDKIEEPVMNEIKIEKSFTEEWFQTSCAMNSVKEEHRNTRRKIVNSIISDKIFMTLYNDGKVVAQGLGVFEREYLGLFDLIVSPDERNKGYGKQLVLNLLKTGKEIGAKYSYLQVMINNPPALRLYEKTGFKESYRYWYRVK